MHINKTWLYHFFFVLFFSDLYRFITEIKEKKLLSPTLRFFATYKAARKLPVLRRCLCFIILTIFIECLHYPLRYISENRHVNSAREISSLKILYMFKKVSNVYLYKDNSYNLYPLPTAHFL